MSSSGAGHFLTVKLRFPRDITATAELAFGGIIGDQATAELTAVPIVLGADSHVPDAAEMKGWFEGSTGPLRVVATERGPGEVVFVRDMNTLSMLTRFGTRLRSVKKTPAAFSLDQGSCGRFLVPVENTQRRSGQSVHLFDVSQCFEASEEAVPWLIMSTEREWGSGLPQSLRDAVAVAAVDASASNGRRAVVLVLGRGKQDESAYDTAAIRAYLKSLHVPLIVWSLESGKSAAARAWLEGKETALPLINYSDLEPAIRALKADLAAQALVWVEGLHLPQDIRLAKAGLPIRIAGAADAAR